MTKLDRVGPPVADEAAGDTAPVVPWAAIAIPVYNEDGITDFLGELDAQLGGRPGLAIVVVDDASTDDTPAALLAARSSMRARLSVLRNERNAGHGPTVLRAYQAAIATGAPVIVQLDGDGQCFASDVWRLFDALDSGAEVVHGVRVRRVDAWYRHVLTFLTKRWCRAIFHTSLADPNSPFRAYRSEVLADLLRDVPEPSLVPNIYLSALAVRRHRHVMDVPYLHRDRRGRGGLGTMWRSSGRTWLVPRRLVAFSVRCIKESRKFAATGALDASSATEAGR